MIDEDERPTRLGGFWALLVGGAVIAAVLAYINPVFRYEDCLNYRSNGNASAFSDYREELATMILLVVWMIAVVVEQALPSTWQYRSTAEVFVRAVAAPLLAVSGSCSLVVNFAAVCH